MELKFLDGLNITASPIEGLIKEQCQKLDDWVIHSLKGLTLDELKWVGVEITDRGITHVDNGVYKTKITYKLFKLERPHDLDTVNKIYEAVHKEDRQ